MLKKTLLATAVIGATLFAGAALLPALAQSRSGAPSTAAPTAPAIADAPARYNPDASDDSRSRNAEHRGEGHMHKVKETHREGHSVETKAGAWSDDSVRSAYEGDKRVRGDRRSDDSRSDHRKDQDKSLD